MLTFLAVFVLSACSPTTEVVRFFWPPPPEEPKLEYLGPYATDADLRRGGSSWFEDVVLGHTRPAPIFEQPQDVASDSKGRVFVSDVALRHVVVLDLNAQDIRILKGDSSRNWLMFSAPFALAADEQGGVYVSDMSQGVIYYFGRDEKVRFAFGKEELERITGMAVDDSLQRLYLVDAPQSKVFVYSLKGEKLQEWGRRGNKSGEFNFPLDVAIDENGDVYVLDALNFRIQVFDPEGNFKRQFGQIGRQLGGFQLPKGIAVDTSGHVYVTDSRAHRMLIFNREGQLLQVVGGYGLITRDGVTPGAFNLPAGIEADNQDSIWVADTLNRSVHRYQFLNDQYLKEHPIDPEQVVRP